MRLPKILLDGDPRLDAVHWRVGESEGAHAIVGWREWVGLPDLGIARLRAKVDTGARTSALHAIRLKPFERDGKTWVAFHVEGERRSKGKPQHEAQVVDQRMVKSSNGTMEMRYVISTALMLAGRRWPIEITLTDRSDMELPMLVGRSAMEGRLLVDPERSYLWHRPKRKSRKAASAQEDNA